MMTLVLLLTLLVAQLRAPASLRSSDDVLDTLLDPMLDATAERRGVSLTVKPRTLVQITQPEPPNLAEKVLAEYSKG